ncbi:MAG: hypothetical protein ACTSRU_19875 [Candidatus Hodarchaeales archaeon]
MSITQVLKCTKCDYSENHPWDERELDPWDLWPNGCPKCGCHKVDVTVIIDKREIIKPDNLKIIPLYSITKHRKRIK